MVVDVFLSYARADRAFAEPFLARFESLGLSVFFDIEEGIDAGDAFPIRIGDAIGAAKAVVALWTPHALTREWCRKECHLAQQLGKLVPIAVQAISPSDLKEFSATSYESCADFVDGEPHLGWSQTLNSLARKFEASAENDADAEAADRVIGLAAVLRREALRLRPAAGARSVSATTNAATLWQRLSSSEDIDELERFANTFGGTEEALAARDRVHGLLAGGTVTQQAKLMLDEGPNFNPSRALVMLERARTAGNLDAEVQVGRIYMRGIGMPRDEKVGSALLRTALSRGSGEAAYWLGLGSPMFGGPRTEMMKTAMARGFAPAAAEILADQTDMSRSTAWSGGGGPGESFSIPFEQYWDMLLKSNWGFFAHCTKGLCAAMGYGVPRDKTTALANLEVALKGIEEGQWPYGSHTGHVPFFYVRLKGASLSPEEQRRLLGLGRDQGCVFSRVALLETDLNAGRLDESAFVAELDQMVKHIGKSEQELWSDGGPLGSLVATLAYLEHLKRTGLPNPQKRLLESDSTFHKRRTLELGLVERLLKNAEDNARKSGRARIWQVVEVRRRVKACLDEPMRAFVKRHRYSGSGMPQIELVPLETGLDQLAIG